MERLINGIVYIATAMWPPKDANPLTYRWRVLITVSLLMTMTTTTACFAAAFGYALAVFPGFARADALTDAVKVTNAALLTLKRGQDDARVQVILSDMIATRTKQCQAIHDNNPAAKAFAEDRFNYDYAQYFSLTGHDWRIPDCSEVN